MRPISILIVSLLLIITTSPSLASPPACHRNDVGKFFLADTVIEASVIKSRRWSEGISTLHLVAKYRVKDVFKGNVEKDSALIITHTCQDKPIPERVIGYPGVMNYCQGIGGLNLTGVLPKDGRIAKMKSVVPNWILFLKRDIRKGAPQQTWLEVSETGFASGCAMKREDLSNNHQPEFDRMVERMNDLKKSSGQPGSGNK